MILNAARSHLEIGDVELKAVREYHDHARREEGTVYETP